ncbi:putative gamma-glutamylcyclotransferase CG2811 isoform X2 [Trichoplusia ni]|uniref:Gamma-glutamylcyclotransferase family protein n=1 Tax=Trichoplusia ni TaxID=7111 RepID=A0A7E5WMS0_TRINI|nr:putative gamma-glutamylcyclotransferase CG2811 isoform X2 [Trichoplusia ni]
MSSALMIKFLGLPVPKQIGYVHTTRMMHKVFVYGTLKRDEPNNYWLSDKKNGHSAYIGEGTTTKKYPLIIATKYNIPFLIFKPGTGNLVKGEVYQVDDAMLGKLDILEDHPNYYVRELDDINTIKDKSNEEVMFKCWVYFLKKFKPELLRRPMLESYSSLGPHGLPYMDSQVEYETLWAELQSVIKK